jgi:NAD(P)-dependent dehydrogenase (short-subunit alcohol dehydrogenase family)
VTDTLEGQVCLITGAAGGIGRACALQFAQAGAQVVLWDRDAGGLEYTNGLLRNALPAYMQVVDLTDPAAVEAGMGTLIERAGRLDALVAVAGGSGRRWGDGPAGECTLEGWARTLDLNLNSLFYTCKWALNTMLPTGGSIVTISSVLGLVGGDADFATHAYAASKGAGISLTRSIAAYYAPQGIRANVICPGLIATPMSRRAQESEAIRARLPQLQPLTGDFGAPEDIAAAAVFLSSPAARFITGAVLTVDGGWTVQ